MRIHHGSRLGSRGNLMGKKLLERVGEIGITKQKWQQAFGMDGWMDEGMCFFI